MGSAWLRSNQPRRGSAVASVPLHRLSAGAVAGKYVYHSRTLAAQTATAGVAGHCETRLRAIFLKTRGVDYCVPNEVPQRTI